MINRHNAINLLAVAGLAFAIVAAFYNVKAHNHIVTAVFFMPFALFGTYMSFLLSEFKPTLSLVAAAFVWLCAVLI